MTPYVIPVLLASAVLVLCWPSTRAENRLREVGVAHGYRHRLPTSAFPVALGLVVALAAGGGAVLPATVIIGMTGWWMRRRRLAERVLGDRIDDLVKALSVMIAELSVGAPPAQACRVAVDEVRRGGGDGLVAGGLESMACRTELGGAVLDVRDLDGGMGEDVSWQRIGVAWQTAERHGLPMIDLLAALRSDLLARKGFTDRTRAGLAGPRATSMVLAGLPVLGIALGQATGARPIAVLTGGGLGGILLVVGVGLAAVGLVWSQRLTARVLTP